MKRFKCFKFLAIISIALFASFGCGGSSSSTTPPTPVYTLSGLVDGPWVDGVTINLTGDMTDSVVTDANGTYTIEDLPAGDYTVTPQLDGYTFTSTSEAVEITNEDITGVDFNAASTIASYTISGTITCPSQTVARMVYVKADNGNWGQERGTNVLLPASTTTVDYVIRGLENYAWDVSAYIDIIGNGSQNQWDPQTAAPAVVTISNADKTQDLTIVNPAAPTVDQPGIIIFPSSDGAVILFAFENDSPASATGYRIFANAGSAPTIAGTSDPCYLTTIITGSDEPIYIHTGLTTGSTYYYQAVPLNGSGAQVDASASVVQNTTIPAAAGNTVSGTLTLSGYTVPAGTNVLVAMIADGSMGPDAIYLNTITTATASSTVSYSLTNVANDTYDEIIAFVDLNNNWAIDAGDLGFGEDNIAFVVDGNETLSATLQAETGDSTIELTISSWEQVTLDPTYSLNINIENGEKQVQSATILTGLNIPLPYDIATNQEGRFQSNIPINSAIPTEGDTYKIKITYSDGTSEFVIKQITNVVDNYATAMSETNTNTLTPTLSFTLASLPAGYTADLRVMDTSWNDQWEYTLTSGDLTSGSVVYASSTALVDGTSYFWVITVRDSENNQATTQADQFLIDLP